MTNTNTNKLRGFVVRLAGLLLVLFGITSTLTAKDKVYPDKPNPPRLVNDFAGMLKPHEEERLEHKLASFDRTTSTQITVVTIKNLGGHDVADYSFKLFNKWGIGQAGKNNGVLLLVALDNRKAWIATGKGLEGALTDAKTSRIFRNELRPAFRAGDYAKGIENSVDAIIAVTKGEYKADKVAKGKDKFPKGLIVLIVLLIIIFSRRRGGGRGGGGYMSGGGFGDIATGMIIGNMLGGGRSSGWGGGGGFGGGGFGGFGGGSSGGGGAGGSW